VNCAPADMPQPDRNPRQSYRSNPALSYLLGSLLRRESESAGVAAQADRACFGLDGIAAGLCAMWDASERVAGAKCSGKIALRLCKGEIRA